MDSWVDAKRKAYRKGAPMCECNCGRKATDAHHWLVRRDSRPQFKPLVDNSLNMAHVCHECHMQGSADVPLFRQMKAATMVAQGHGPELIEWLDELESAGKYVKEQKLLVSKLLHKQLEREA